MFNKPNGLNMAAKTIQPTPLSQETRVSLTTAEAAFHLNRAPQTMRLWACHESGPIRPLRINGRLAWPVSELRRLLRVETEK